MLAAIVVLALLGRLSALVYNHEHLEAIVPAQDFELHRNAFRRTLKASPDDGKLFTFLHTRELLEALRTQQPNFEAAERFTAEDAAKWKLGTFQDTLDKGYYHAITKYTLHPEVDYVDYDALHSGGELRNLGEDHLEHCAESRELNALARVTAHAALLGSSLGGWHPSSPSTSSSTAAAVLLLAHRVLSVSSSPRGAQHCVRLELEAVHPWELFSSVSVQAVVEHPFDTSYNEQQSEQQERELQFAQPDSPLMTCNNPFYDDVDASRFNPYIVKAPYLKINKNKGCAIFQKDIPGSFAANYDVSTRKAARSLDWGSLSCDNCFVVAGAGVLAVLNYVATWNFLTPTVVINVQLKLAGTAGAAVSLTGKAGTFAASRQFQLANAGGSKIRIPIGTTGLTLTLQFGGASLKLSGSATFEGSFSVAYGRLGTASLGMMATNGAPRFAKELRWDNLDKPFSNKGFRVSNWMLSTEVIGRMLAQLSFGGALTANFNFYVGTTVTITSPSGGNGREMPMGDVAVALSTRRALHDNPAAATTRGSFRPGDVLSLSHAYSGFQPKDDVELYYTLKSLRTGLEYAIANSRLRCADSGSGTVESHWTLPWNLDYSPLGQAVDASYGTDMPDDLKDSARAGKDQFVVQVRCNYLMDAAIGSSEPFDIEMFTPNDGIFSSPAMGAEVPANAPFTVQWLAPLLRRFQPGMHTWTGQDVQASYVRLELVGESLDTYGNVAASHAFPLQALSQAADPTANPNLDPGLLAIPNTGSAVIALHPNMTAPFDRFYLLVSDVEKRQVQGWSKGYFTVARSGHLRVAARAGVHMRVAGGSSKEQSHPTLGTMRRTPTAQEKTINPSVELDLRILQTLQDRSLFGGVSQRNSIYEPRPETAAAPGAEEPKAVLLQEVLSGGRPPSARSLVKVRARVAQRGQSKRAAGGDASKCNAPINLPWKVTIFGGAGFDSIKIPYVYSRTFGLERRANLVTLGGSISLPKGLARAVNVANSGNAGNKGSMTDCNGTQGEKTGSPTKKPAVKMPTVKRSKKPTAKKPTAKKPTAKKPTANKPTAKKPTAKKPNAKKPTANKPTAKKPTAKKATANKPTAKKPTAKKPNANKPTAKKATAKKPVAPKRAVSSESSSCTDAQVRAKRAGCKCSSAQKKKLARLC